MDSWNSPKDLTEPIMWLLVFCFREPLIAGGQPDDDRIYVENRIERAPDYTETGELLCVFT